MPWSGVVKKDLPVQFDKSISGSNPHLSGYFQDTSHQMKTLNQTLSVSDYTFLLASKPIETFGLRKAEVVNQTDWLSLSSFTQKSESFKLNIYPTLTPHSNNTDINLSAYK